MRGLRYLNVMLTLIAVLLTLQLWTAWVAPPTMLTGSAMAAPTSRAKSRSAKEPGGIPDAGAQRAETIRLLRQSNQNTEALIGLFRTGEARVRVEGGTDTDQ